MKRRILWLTVDVDDFLAFSSFSYDNNTQHGVKETKSFLFLVFPFYYNILLELFLWRDSVAYWSIEGCMSRERHRVTWLHHHHAHSAEDREREREGL
jgi:hypothetical protein